MRGLVKPAIHEIQGVLSIYTAVALMSGSTVSIAAVRICSIAVGPDAAGIGTRETSWARVELDGTISFK